MNRKGSVFIGIDPGLSGALAVISADGIQIFDTPICDVVVAKKNRHDYLIANMAQHLREWAPTNPEAILEKVGAMPGEGAVSSFSFGRGLGLWEGLLSALVIPYTKVHPTTWKKVMLGDMGKDKDASRLRASQLFPSLATQLSRKRDHGRAEALLLAVYGQRLRRSEV